MIDLQTFHDIEPLSSGARQIHVVYILDKGKPKGTLMDNFKVELCIL